MSRIRTIAILPAMFTLANLFCGFFSIVAASRIDKPLSAEVSRTQAIGSRVPTRIVEAFDVNDPTHNIILCGSLIFLAMVFDALDGHVARLSRTSSDFGAQLDSLCDVVTFGAAPAFLLVKMCPSVAWWSPHIVWLIPALFVACAAMRLARFNVETGDDDDHMNFSGLPSPAAAAVVASSALLFYSLRNDTIALANIQQIDQYLQGGLMIFSALVALLMVSRIPYPHVVNQMLHGRRSFGHLVGLLFAVVAVLVVPFYTLPVVAYAFAISGPAKFFWQWAVRRQHREESWF
ncbi:MAG: CDP-diacylglycerol--serine O-phosphatidyltransferase [Planctomycetia bacterium]|nr:CDP-diacylglycerol--serine O-phosphatidyltransferase [Planctomycetia bacterium]